MRKHKYDDPSITMIEILREIARDTTLPILTRIDAAAKALPYEFGEPRLTIIVGGLPPGYDAANVSVEAKDHDPAPPVIGHA